MLSRSRATASGAPGPERPGWSAHVVDETAGGDGLRLALELEHGRPPAPPEQRPGEPVRPSQRAARAAVLERRDAGPDVFGQRAGNVLGGPGVPDPLDGQHDPVERVLRRRSQTTSARWPYQSGAVGLRTEPPREQVTRLVR